MLIDLIDSIVSKAKDIQNVEFLIKIDDDDVDSGYVHLLEKSFGKSINYKIFVETRTDNLSQDYYNYLAKKAEGDLIWALNDDCKLHGSEGWDKIIVDSIYKRNLNHRIAYINTGVSGHTDIFAPFPILSREAINALGYFHHHLIKTWDGDVVLWNTFNGLKNVYGIDRMIDLRSKITMVHFNGNGQMHDSTREGMRLGHQTNGGLNAADFNGHGLYPQAVDKLKAGIDREK
jgi:hypothetical protein